MCFVSVLSRLQKRENDSGRTLCWWHTVNRLIQETSESFLCQLLMHVRAISCTRIFHNKHSRPIRPLTFGHVLARFLHRIELCCIRCKKLSQEKSCLRNHMRHKSLLCNLACTRVLWKNSCLCVISISLGQFLAVSELRTRLLSLLSKARILHWLSCDQQ